MIQSSWNMDLIPEPLIFDFLIRLPVKSLVRFKCINRFWYDLISDPPFIYAHLKRSKAAISNDSCLLLISCSLNDDLSSASTVYFFTVKDYTTAPAVLEYSVRVSFDSYIVLPSCNGLVCFYALTVAESTFATPPPKTQWDFRAQVLQLFARCAADLASIWKLVLTKSSGFPSRLIISLRTPRLIYLPWATIILGGQSSTTQLVSDFWTDNRQSSPLVSFAGLLLTLLLLLLHQHHLPDS